MKCLSVCQPFADLIVARKKTIELRSWNTKFRGEFLVHAPAKVIIQDCNRLGIADCITSVIIGRAELYGVKTYCSARELAADKRHHFAKKRFPDVRYGFLLKNAKALRVPIPYKGSLGFFEADIESEFSKNEIHTEIADKEHRYRLVGHH